MRYGSDGRRASAQPPQNKYLRNALHTLLAGATQADVEPALKGHILGKPN